MKNLFKYTMLVATAAMAFTSCSKDTTEDLPVAGGEEATMRITINPDIRDTRVSLDENHSKLCWVNGDKIGLFTNVGTTAYNATYNAETAADSLVANVAEGSTKVYAYYPYYSSNDENGVNKVSLYISADQNQAEAGKLQGTVNSDGTGSGQYPMVATGTIDENKNVSLTFRPMASAFAINVYGTHEDGEVVQSVSFTPNGDINNVSAQSFDLDNLPDDKFYTGSKSETATVTLGTPFEPAAGKPTDTQTYDKQVYICTARTNYSAGGTFVVTTNKAKYTFAITSGLDCSNTDFYRINLNLAKGDKPVTKLYEQVTEERADWSGRYIIACTDASTNAGEVMSNEFDGSYFTDAGITLNDDGTFECSNAYEIQVEKLSDGNYALKSGAKYIAHSSSTKFKLVDDTSDNNSHWTISLTSQKNIEIINVGATDRLIKYNSSLTSDNKDTQFRLYTSNSSVKSITLYTEASPRSSIEVAEADKNLQFGAKADTKYINFTANIIEGDQLTAKPNADWLTAKINTDNNLELNVTDNTTEAARTATVTLSAGKASVEITVNQASNKLATPVVTVKPTTTSVTLSWDKVSDAGKYSYIIGEKKAETTQTRVTVDLAEGEYTYSVYAEPAEGSIYTTSDAAEGSFSIGKQKLPAPTVKVSDDITTSGFTATWTAVDNAASYDWKLLAEEKTTDADIDTAAAITNGNTSEAAGIKAEGLTLTAGTTYYLYVKSLPANTDTHNPSQWGKTPIEVPAAETTVTIDLSKKGYTNGQVISTVTDASGITLTFDKGSNSNTPKYYTSGSAVRLYGGGTLTVSGKTIKGVTFGFGSGDGSIAITANPGTYDEPTWTGEAQSVKFTVGGTSGNRRFQTVTVTYTE